MYYLLTLLGLFMFLAHSAWSMAQDYKFQAQSIQKELDRANVCIQELTKDLQTLRKSYNSKRKSLKKVVKDDKNSQDWARTSVPTPILNILQPKDNTSPNPSGDGK